MGDGGEKRVMMEGDERWERDKVKKEMQTESAVRSKKKPERERRQSRSAAASTHSANSTQTVHKLSPAKIKREERNAPLQCQPLPSLIDRETANTKHKVRARPQRGGCAKFLQNNNNNITFSPRIRLARWGFPSAGLQV